MGQIEKLFENFYPPKVATTDTAAENSENAVSKEDPEIAALEAQLAALKKAKAAASKEGEMPEVAPSGAAFRDALLVALGSNRVSAAQLQNFFVTHRKCTAAEAIADVGSIVKCIEKRKDQEAAAEEAKKPGKEVEGQKTNADQTAAPQCQSGGKGAEARTVHVHIHSSDQ